MTKAIFWLSVVTSLILFYFGFQRIAVEEAHYQKHQAEFKEKMQSVQEKLRQLEEKTNKLDKLAKEERTNFINLLLSDLGQD